MPTIKQDDFIASVADALQYISYYHPEDFVSAMASAYEKEQSESAKAAIAQILMNSKMSAEGRRPVCQDTGIVTAFVKVGMNASGPTRPAATIATLCASAWPNGVPSAPRTKPWTPVLNFPSPPGLC